jgi:hypothetical protein
VQIGAVAADLTAWLQLLALDGDLAHPEPKLLRFGMLHLPARSPAAVDDDNSVSQPTGHGLSASSKRSPES